MNNPDHQHFIPKSYLKNFARRDKKKKFVEIFDKHTNEIKIVSTRGICVKTGLYTLPKTETNDPYKLENYYAKNVDDVYPEVYNLLVNDEIITISKNQKRKILYTLMSLYFRTPKFLNSLNRVTDESLEKVMMLTDPDKDEIVVDFLGQELKFLRQELDEVKTKLYEQNRQDFITTHLQQWHEFVAYKYQCAISVFKVEGDVDLITSDNPVIIHSAVQNKFHLYDPTNIIEVPLDRRHFLFVYPNTETSSSTKITRGIRDKHFGLTLNYQVQKKAEQWIIGFPESCKKHLADQIKYGEYNDENLKTVELIEQRAKLMSELLSTMEKYGFPSIQVADKIKAFKKLECFTDNHDIEEISEQLKQEGYSTD